MGKDSKIEWTDHTFNPWWGCVKIGAGCQHCYAETLAHRFGHDVWGPDKPRRFLRPAYWAAPLAWAAAAQITGSRARVFCGSMCDWAEKHPDQETAGKLDRRRDLLFKLIEKTPALDWLLLTKRPGNVLDLLPQRWTISGELPPHVWLGISASTRAELYRDWLDLDQAANDWSTASMTFVSLEPLLEDVAEQLETIYQEIEHKNEHVRILHDGPLSQQDRATLAKFDAELPPWGSPWGSIDWPSQPPGWVIVGAETGHGARPMDPAWARRVLEVCRAHDVPFFMKQLTDKAPIPPDLMVREFPKAGPLPKYPPFVRGSSAWFAELKKRR